MAAAYPTSLKVFSVFHDYTDIIWAMSINECHDEILALEKALGTNPFLNTPYTSFGGAIQDLYNNKAPKTHTHTHKNLLDDTQGNDHPQYIMVNGYPGFSRPVNGKAGTGNNDLVPLGQLHSLGYLNAAQVEALINAALGNLMAGVDSNPPLAGSSAATGPRWHLQGGLTSGVTDGNGQVWVNFHTPYGHCLQAFVATKLPPQRPAAGYPATPYNWVEAQLTLVYASGTQAALQFSHDYSWQPNQFVTFSWIAIGT